MANMLARAATVQNLPGVTDISQATNIESSGNQTTAGSAVDPFMPPDPLEFDARLASPTAPALFQ